MSMIALAIVVPHVSSAGEIKMRDAARHDDLVKVKREEMAEGKRVEPPSFVPAEGDDPSVTNRPGDLLARSEILAFRGKATLVPKRALLHVPPRYRARVGDIKGCRLVTWLEFYRENSGWIDTHEVSISTASGNSAVEEESLEKFAERERVVVATLMRGPVSVLPLKEPPPEEETEQAEESPTGKPTVSVVE